MTTLLRSFPVKELRAMALAGETCGIKEVTDGFLEKCDRGAKDKGVEVILEK